MTEEVNEQIPTNEEVINDITKNLESEFVINTENEDNEDNEDKSKIIQGNSAVKIGERERNSGVPEGFDTDTKPLKPDLLDDYIDEEKLKDLEVTLSEEEKETRLKEALELKKRGNDEFKNEKYLESVITYTEALKLCPLKYDNDRSIFYANRAASKTKLERKQSAIEDCSKALELNDTYVKVYLRRAKLYEETEKLDESLEDYKKILSFDPGNRDALQAQYRLPPLIAERNEKLKTEMLGKLKDLGNMILKPFGLSTDNFQLQQDPNSGGYSVNFAQNSKR
ncbi:hypothetical protein NQ314_002847 [Rhamnusium bicolor]|uniref:Tetratricopeptide repeat protein 1 n=1 Tax=Rhamnusium bicolor TaxID=1586634 RepID=A0AAV8ZQR0_9CUCU|nr:hypothetical protein NQ314_002847 [Rhamnusium bicolor]